MSDLFDKGHPSKRDGRKLKRERRKEKYRKMIEWQEAQRASQERLKIGLALYEEALTAQDALRDAQAD